MRSDVTERLLNLTNSTKTIKITAISALGEAGSASSSVLYRLLELSNDSDLDVQLAAIKALGRVSRPRMKT